MPGILPSIITARHHLFRIPGAKKQTMHPCWTIFNTRSIISYKNLYRISHDVVRHLVRLMFMFTTNHAVILSVTMAPRRSGPHSGMIQGEECQLKHWKATGLLLRLISVQPTKVMLGRQCFCLSATFCDFTICYFSISSDGIQH